MSSGTTREDTGGGRSSADQGERPQEEPACPHQDLALPAPDPGDSKLLLFKPPSRGPFVRWPTPNGTGT